MDFKIPGRLSGSNLTCVDCIAHVCITRVVVQLMSRTSELEFCPPQVNVSTFVANSLRIHYFSIDKTVLTVISCFDKQT